MNIIMVSMDYPPTVGGIAAHVFELSRALSGLGHNVSVLTRKLKQKEQQYTEHDTVRIFTVDLKFINIFYGLQTNSAIKKLLPKTNPDIIHIHGLGPLEWYDIKDIPLAYTNHTSGYLKKIEKGGFRRITYLKRLFKKPALFLAPSNELLETPFPIQAKKLFISNGIDSSKHKRDEYHRKRIRKELNLNEQDIVGILTRRLVRKNGVIHLARATRYIKNPHLKFILIGDGEERDAIAQELNRHFSGRYCMLGSKPHDAIIPFYSAADFSILPSLMEATSISGLEAMASSLPLVGTRVGGIPELIREGENGFLCNPADEQDLAAKIDQLLAAPFPAMGNRSRELVEEKFDWRQIAAQTLKAYESVL